MLGLNTSDSYIIQVNIKSLQNMAEIPDLSRLGGICYNNIMARRGGTVSGKNMIHVYNCNGFERGPNSTNPCPTFVNVSEVLIQGICAYEVRSRGELGESIVKSAEHSCSECHSDWNSGKNPDSEDPDKRGCTGYTPELRVSQDACAWQLRSERLVDFYDGDITKLQPEERYCLEGCKATIATPSECYIPIRHVVENTCVNGVRVEIKSRLKQVLSDLEQNCLSCITTGGSKKCPEGSTGVNEVHHFAVINDMHPLKFRKKAPLVQITSAS